MKDRILEEASKGRSMEHKRNLLREALHHVILQEADRRQAFRDLCFVGGTALRILFGLDRFSEDLDFSLSQEGARDFRLASVTTAIGRALDAFGLHCAVEGGKTTGAVQSCYFSFTGLLHQIDRQARATQKLSIKFEVDTRPPAGAHEQISPVTGPRLYKVRHYDIASLFAGKLHAILHRPFDRGRDLYDFLWYVGRKTVSVNGPLLAQAIEQTQHTRPHLDTPHLQRLLTERFQRIDFDKAKQDVAPFLEDRAALTLFDRQIFLDAVTRVAVAAP